MDKLITHPQARSISATRATRNLVRHMPKAGFRGEAARLQGR